MASEALSNIRSLEDVVYLLNILFTNLNNLDRVYYDMFINPVPMDIELERYNELGELVTITLPNRAKDKLQTYIGTGDPNGQQAAPEGSMYLNKDNLTLWFKSKGSDSQNWIMLWDIEHLNYLAPDGDGSQLQNLNATNINTGILKVANGGTGTNSLTGLIKGNGLLPFTSAVEGTDYIKEDTFIGMISFFPKNQQTTRGWLRCDGAAYNRLDYPKLASYLGISTEQFNVPDLMGYFIRCYGGNSGDVNIEQTEAIGPHTHEYSGTIASSGGHTHEILPNVPVYTQVSSGAYITSGTPVANLSQTYLNIAASSGQHTHNYSGTTDNNSGLENRPTNKALVTMIRCDLR